MGFMGSMVTFWGAAKNPYQLSTNLLRFGFREVQISLCSGFDQEVVPMFPWPLPYGALSVYLCVWAYMCTHTLRCLTIIVFPFGLYLPFSSGYQRPAFTVISAWLRHGSNHCRSGVSALAQDWNTTDWHRLQRKVILWQTVVLAGNSGYHNHEGEKGTVRGESGGGLASQKRGEKDYLWIIRANKIKEQDQVWSA